MTWQKHRFTKVIEQIPIVVVVTLPDGAIEYANSPLHRLLGLNAAQLSKVDLAQFRVAGAAPPARGRNGDGRSVVVDAV